MLNQYLATALWSSDNYSDEENPDDCTPFDEDYGIEDFSKGARQDAIADCAIFEVLLRDTPCPVYGNLWEAAMSYGDEEQIGHDFWLTRNGHGAGFWDGDYGNQGDAISKVVRDNFVGCDLCVSGDGEVEFL